MSARTQLAEEAFCIACGASAAPLLCSCKLVSFCNDACKNTAWSEHRLVCRKTGGKERKASSKFLPGDIVKIHGLSNQAGQQFNGCLAEVQSFDKEKQRYTVLFSNKKQQIKTVRALSEHLELHLTYSDAARAAYERDKKEGMKTMTTSQAEMAQIAVMQHVMQPQQFVKAMKNPKEFTVAMEALQALVLDIKKPKPAFCAELMVQGMARECLKHFHFPFSLDNPEICNGQMFEGSVHKGVALLSQCLKHIKKDKAYNTACTKFVHDIVQMVHPYVLLMCSKKHRIFGSVDSWCRQQFIFLELLGDCCEQVPETAYLMPKECLAALREHMVMLLTVDHKKFMSSSAQGSESNRGLTGASITMVINNSLVKKDSAQPADVEKFGLTPVPFGARDGIGQPFVSVAPKVIARLILDMERDDYLFSSLGMCRQYQLICTQMMCCPNLLMSYMRETNGYSIKFLMGFESREEYFDWAKKLLQSDESKQSQKSLPSPSSPASLRQASRQHVLVGVGVAFVLGVLSLLWWFQRIPRAENTCDK